MSSDLVISMVAIIGQCVCLAVCFIFAGKRKRKVYFMENNKSAITIFLTALWMFFIFVGLPGTSISAEQAVGKQEVKKEAKQPRNPYVNAEITIKIIPSINNTFGYDILLYGRPLVHQPNIPGLPGNKGFTTKGRAQKVAEFVVKKIRKNKMPPTVTIEDLNRMGVLK